MTLIRFLMILVIVLSTPLSGAMAAGHPFASDMAQEAANSEVTSVGHGMCCEENTDRSPSCHVLTALVPALTNNTTTPTQMRSAIFGFPTVLAGIEPAGPLDPPRLG
ncbi:hypothetical protein [Oceaniovalibus sp. ACAM 378]|uniref:hypothetical protein n=1 Tax=Oceaniovalibus sp. ACAM 378 TaxID=2599923 RepID=UPI0011D7488F|nr:hypothetical protein [Oceaniovalibus sp. ACAM 378]TYB88396.1 hypothetical protein FQ320_10370 [Oceaniovalibus sp. ACAM 378]